MSGRPSPDGGEAARGGRPAIASILPPRVRRSQKGRRAAPLYGGAPVASCTTSPGGSGASASRDTPKTLGEKQRTLSGIPVGTFVLNTVCASRRRSTLRLKDSASEDAQHLLGHGVLPADQKSAPCSQKPPGSSPQGPPRPCTRGALVRDLPHWRGRAGWGRGAAHFSPAFARALAGVQVVGAEAQREIGRVE